MFNDQTEPQLVPKLLLHVSVRELHNSLVSDINDGGIKDASDYIWTAASKPHTRHRVKDIH